MMFKIQQYIAYSILIVSLNICEIMQVYDVLVFCTCFSLFCMHKVSVNKKIKNYNRVFASVTLSQG